MAGGIGIDLLLVAALLAAAGWLYRGRPGAAAAPGFREPAAQGWRQRIAGRVGGYYPRVARQAGYDPGALRELYWVAKGVCGLLLPLLLLEAWSVRGGDLGWPALLLVPALAGFVLPDLWLLGRRRRRRRQISRALGFFVDLLVAFLYSGLSLEQAFHRVSREGFERNHPLARELALVSRELRAGQDPSLAFQALAERTGVADLRAIASALRIGLRVGTPVRTTLQAQSEALWTKRREAALRQINAAATQVMFPVMLCGFPIFFLLTFFPAILEIVELLRSIRSGL